MAGIYIHIPFCKKACHYCNFHFSTSLKSIDAVVQSIKTEISKQSSYLKEPVTTIYFGGGTPSILNTSLLESILAKLESHFSLATEEITLECNPDDITFEKLAEWNRLGINRLSIGVQSFHEHHLTWMNRSHNAEQSINSIKWAQKAGFENLTIDLIFGFAGLSKTELKENLRVVQKYAIPHLSVYGMTIEPKTALGHQTKTGQYLPLPEAEANAQMLMIMEELDRQGYEQYEISNYAMPKKRALHNSNYWQGATYLGLGPGAHSFNGTSRHWNIANNQKYIKLIQQGQPVYEVEQLSTIDRYNEYVMIRLRTIEGINLDQIENLFPAYFNYFIQNIRPFIGKHVQKTESSYRLTQKGKFITDLITSAVFKVNRESD